MTFSKGHALLIGVGTYKDAPHLDVPITVGDAEEVAAVLQNPRYCGYPKGQVTLLHDASATRERILNELDRLAAKTTEENTVLIFYAGHGFYDQEKNYYLTTHETKLENRKVVAGSAIAEKELLEKLLALKSKRAFLIFNACYSGALSPDSLGDPEHLMGENLPEQTAMALLKTGEGRVIITACRENQKSYFKRGEPMTIFAEALTDGLRGKGINSRRGYISVFDLYDYVFSSVKSEAQRRWDLTQEPELTIHKGIGAMAIALHRGKSGVGELGIEDRPTSLSGKVRELDPAESRQMLRQILHGDSNVAAGRDITNSSFHWGDSIDARRSVGFNNRPTGPVNQVFGDKRNINTGGGDYAEGNIDKRKGIFGGQFTGQTVGVSEGAVTFYPSSTTEPRATVSLQEAYQKVQQAVEQARQSDNEELADELQGVELDLKAALRAQNKGDASKRQSKLSQAREDLTTIAEEQPHLQSLVKMLQQVQ